MIFNVPIFISLLIMGVPLSFEERSEQFYLSTVILTALWQNKTFSYLWININNQAKIPNLLMSTHWAALKSTFAFTKKSQVQHQCELIERERKNKSSASLATNAGKNHLLMAEKNDSSTIADETFQNNIVPWFTQRYALLFTEILKVRTFLVNASSLWKLFW